jgi:predicted acyltransferase
MEQPKTSSVKSIRIESVDVYRGLVMFLMMAEVWHLGRISDNLPNSSFWALLGYHQSHVAWVGCSLHDLIQPSFTFLVGVALPYSILSRQNKGESQGKMWYHAIRRSIILILLGVFLRSMHSEITNWTFEDTLTQIGLGYPFLFFLGSKSKRWLLWSLGITLFLYWLAFVLYPINSFDYPSVGVPENWEHLKNGFEAHWNKNSNLAWAFDTWFLNLFPRDSPFLFNGGGYATLSFIPTFGTMILGLLAGRMLKEKESFLSKKWAIIGLLLIAVALLIHFAGLNPIVKRIWTPSWVLFSGGFCFLFLASFHYIVDNKGIKKPFQWLRIIGLNSIAAYVLAHTLEGFIDSSIRIHINQNYAMAFGETYESLVSGSIILLFYWLFLKWLYNKKLFIKI